MLDAHARDPFGQRQREAAVRDLGALGGADAAEAVVPLFDDPFVHLADRAVSAWIAMLKGPRAKESADWLAKEGLGHRDPRVRRGAAVALGFDPEGRGKAALARLVDGLGDRRIRRAADLAVVVEVARALGRLEAAESLDALLQRPEGEVVLAAAEARLDRPLEEGLVADLLAHAEPLARAGGVLLAGGAGLPLPEGFLEREKAPEPRIVLARVAAAAGDGETLGRLLADQDWRVRAAAVAEAEASGRRAFVPLLADRLAAEEGRLVLDLHRALRRLSGADIPPDAELWRAWWKANAERSDGPAAPSAAPGDVSTRAAFFRLPVRSKRIAFLLDASGSMRDPADPASPSGPSKWDRAREETVRTLEALGDAVAFDVFVYRYPSEYPPRSEMTRALGRLREADPRNVKKAAAWLARQEAAGWGAFSDALEALLETEADTIYFLSDGRPSRGTYDRDFRLLDELARANRFRRVVVHTVLVGRGGADREFLERLALETGGFFVDATVR